MGIYKNNKKFSGIFDKAKNIIFDKTKKNLLKSNNVQDAIDENSEAIKNITPSSIGALTTDGDSANNITTFTSGDNTNPATWTNVSVLTSKEKHSSIFNKISNMFKNVRYLYKMLGTTDISAIGGGTVTGAISTINNNLPGRTNNSKALLWTDTEGGNLELFSPNGNHVQMDMYENERVRIYSGTPSNVIDGNISWSKNLSLNLDKFVNVWGGQAEKIMDNSTESYCEWYRFGNIVYINGNITPKNTELWNLYPVFWGIPRVYATMRIPVWTDNEGITSWITNGYEDRSDSLYLHVRGSLNGKICYFSGMYITKDQ